MLILSLVPPPPPPNQLFNSLNSLNYFIKKQNYINNLKLEQELIKLEEEKDHLIPIKLEIELDNDVKYDLKSSTRIIVYTSNSTSDSIVYE